MKVEAFNDTLRRLIEKRTGRPISDRRLKAISALIVIGFMATFAMLSGSGSSEENASTSFKATRVANAFGAVWERKVGAKKVKYVAKIRTDAEMADDAKDIVAIPIPAQTADGHHFNSTVPLFISKDAMSAGVRMIVQGVTDPEILGPYTSCVAQAGDGFVSINGSWTASEVVLTDGANKGCRGWTANEFIAKR